MKIRIVVLCAALLTVFAPGAATAAPPSYSPPVTTVITDTPNYLFGVAVDSNGNLYIADTLNSRIQRVTFDTNGTPTTTTVAGTDGQGNGPNQLLFPDGVAVDSNDNLYIADTDNNRIQRVTFNTNSTPTTTTVAGGTSGDAVDELARPRGVTIDSNGNLYIADTDNNRIQRVTFDTNGTPTTTTVAGGTSGGGVDELIYPRDIAIDTNDNLYIADTGNNRIQRVTFDTNGTPTAATTVAGTGIAGTNPNQLDQPRGVAVDTNGNLYIADRTNHRVQKITIDTNGTPTNTITVAGGNGQGNETNQLRRPNGLIIDTNGDLYIADTSNYRIQKITLDIINPTVDNNTPTQTRAGSPSATAYTCADAGGSELASCTATLDGQPVNNGDALNTSKRGIQTLVVTAVDGVGNTTTETVTITVHGKRELTGAYKNATGTNASVARLYMATFKRAPEGDGFDFWVTANNNGKTLQAMADFFVAGKEFGIVYGNTTNAEFVDLMYQNVMGRAPGIDAKTFWLNELDTGNRTRAQMLLWFSESKEFKILTYTS